VFEADAQGVQERGMDGLALEKGASGEEEESCGDAVVSGGDGGGCEDVGEGQGWRWEGGYWK